jgi:hypothetical protein
MESLFNLQQLTKLSFRAIAGVTNSTILNFTHASPANLVHSKVRIAKYISKMLLPL